MVTGGQFARNEFEAEACFQKKLQCRIFCLLYGFCQSVLAPGLRKSAM